MSSNSATTTTSTDNGISLVEADERGAEGGEGDDQLTINSLSSSLSSSTATTDTEGESGTGDGGRKREKRRGDGSFSRGSSAKEIEQFDEEEAAEDALLDDEAPPYAAKTRDRAIGRLIVFSCILFTVPLTLMYITYRFLFIGHYQLAHDRAILYAGIVAAATVYLLLALFAWIAYRDETEFAKEVAISVAEGEGDKKTD
ncbi:hypothetical protein niasHS_007571 [Heterodera schachtii]|uniref:Vacuolar ATPase assembly integral membrane protein VMA21 n=1 Tax=Heterodera schachtii TaxID=97005 RepID=A0ABD2JP76_HETSC